MLAIRATRLTWRLHRFEAVALMAMLALSAWVVTAVLRGFDIPSGCWDQANFGDEEVTGWCADLLDRYHQVTGNEGGHILLGLKLVPLAVGLVLGVPVVAREVELRTAHLAWSLEARRWRWVMARCLPLLMLAVAGLVVLGVVGEEVLALQSPGNTWDLLGDLGARGLPLVTRGIATFAIALLAGAVLGRTLPGLLVATVLALGLATFDGTFVPNTVARSFAVWVPVAETRTGYVHSLGWRPIGATDQPADDVGTVGDEYELLVVPMTAVPTLDAIQAGIDLAVSGLAIAGTLLVVARRRPD
ncbi:MAG: hypothetical protein U0667_05580 [Chloroflexota bacterium]